MLRSEHEMLAFVEEAEARDVFLPVVLAGHTPWILYVSEDGDGYAHSVPAQDIEDDQPTLSWGALLAENAGAVPLAVLWDGRPTYPESDVRAVLEGIYEDARGAITAPVHHALMGAASRLERLLGIHPGTPGFNRSTGGGESDGSRMGLVTRESLAGGKGSSESPTGGDL
jgi:hypothetical protein